MLRYKIHYTPPIHIHFTTELTIAHMRRCKTKKKIKIEIFVFIYSAEMLSYISKYLLVVFSAIFCVLFRKILQVLWEYKLNWKSYDGVVFACIFRLMVVESHIVYGRRVRVHFGIYVFISIYAEIFLIIKGDSSHSELYTV